MANPTIKSPIERSRRYVRNFAIYGALITIPMIGFCVHEAKRLTELTKSPEWVQYSNATNALQALNRYRQDFIQFNLDKAAMNFSSLLKTEGSEETTLSQEGLVSALNEVAQSTQASAQKFDEITSKIQENVEELEANPKVKEGLARSKKYDNVINYLLPAWALLLIGGAATAVIKSRKAYDEYYQPNN